MIAARLCVDCKSEAAGVRCPDCAEVARLERRLQWRARRVTKGVYACKGCGEKGHNVRTCNLFSGTGAA